MSQKEKQLKRQLAAIEKLLDAAHELAHECYPKPASTAPKDEFDFGPDPKGNYVQITEEIGHALSVIVLTARKMKDNEQEMKLKARGQWN